MDLEYWRMQPGGGGVIVEWRLIAIERRIKMELSVDAGKWIRMECRRSP